MARERDWTSDPRIERRIRWWKIAGERRLRIYCPLRGGGNAGRNRRPKKNWKTRTGRAKQYRVADAIRLRDGKARQGSGKPHTAEELVVIAGTPPRFRYAARSSGVFVKGKVRHEDHKTVSLKSWREVIRNNESNAGRVAGVGWID